MNDSLGHNDWFYLLFTAKFLPLERRAMPVNNFCFKGNKDNVNFLKRQNYFQVLF